MFKIKAGILMLGAVVFSGSAFAGINSNEKELRQSVLKCIHDIHGDSTITSPDLEKITTIIYSIHGGVKKYCGSVSDKTRKTISSVYEQQEGWDAEYKELYEEYMAIPIPERNKPHARTIMRKILALMAPDKLGGMNSSNKLNTYRAMLKEVDQLDAMLMAIDYN